MRAFVTGGTGFIGGRVVRRLRERGDDVVALVRSPAKASDLAELGCELVEGDLTSADAIRRGVQGCDAVFHIAAVYKVGIPASEREPMREANVRGTEIVLDAAVEAGVKKIVFVSTIGVFGNTRGEIVNEGYRHDGQRFLSCYEETKYQSHEVARDRIAQGAPVVIVQPGGVYGPGDTSQVADLLEQFFAGRMPLLPFPELGICLTHVEDIAGGILLAIDKAAPGETYVISGPVTTMRDAIETVAGLTGRKAPKHAMPVPLMKAMTPIGPLVGKMLGQPPNLRELISSADGVTFWASHEKASRDLGYSPRGMEEGLRQTLEADDRFPAPTA